MVLSNRRLFVPLFVYSNLHFVHSFPTLAILDGKSTSVQFRGHRKRTSRLSGGETKNKENDGLDRKLLSISFFSFLHQAAMPFAEIIDSAYLAKMDSVSLGAFGVAKSSQVRKRVLKNRPCDSKRT